ncbi:MAG: T9SS type A sorting domain-containing protein [Flavobacterium sp.]|nr:T9SS type A sorting domain-containing protein [Flavobacterium sp.]
MNKTTYSTKQRFINQTKKVSLFSVLLMTGISFGQTTVFSDNFNRATLSPGGTPSVSYTQLSLKNDRTPQTTEASYGQIVSSMSAGSAATSIDFTNTNPPNAFLNLIQGGTTNSGTIQVTAPLSAYTAPFSPILKNNTQLVEWSFNMRTNRGSATGSGLSGFSVDGSGTNYGMIVILAGSNSNVMQGGTGYVVTFHQVGGGVSDNVVSLRKYADGAYSCGSGCPVGGSTMTSIILPGTPLANKWNFVSVKVTYNPSNDEWKLFVRDDGDMNWADPSNISPSGTANLVGSVIDNTYTMTSMNTFGFYFKHGTSNVDQNQAYFDNYKVVLNNTLSSSSFDYVSTTLYPNPAKNQLTISSKNSFNSIEILNLLGQKVKEVANKQGETALTVDVSDLQNATYIVKLNSNEGVSTTKFVKN